MDLDNKQYQRNMLVSLLTTCFPAVQRKTDIDGWDDTWHNCVYIMTPKGQLSFHYHDTQSYMFRHVPQASEDFVYDGHDTVTKWGRVTQLVARHDPDARLGRLVVNLDPGGASPQLISEYLMSLNDLCEALGGGSLVSAAKPDKSPEHLCDSCGNEIDPSLCYCGEHESDHGNCAGHRFTPMGCRCGYDKSRR